MKNRVLEGEIRYRCKQRSDKRLDRSRTLCARFRIDAGEIRKLKYAIVGEKCGGCLRVPDGVKIGSKQFGCGFHWNLDGWREQVLVNR